MRGFRRWSAEETDIGHGIALFRAAPGEVLAERETAWAAELTPNMVVLGTAARAFGTGREAPHVSALTLASCACEEHRFGCRRRERIREVLIFLHPQPSFSSSGEPAPAGLFVYSLDTVAI
jgi:hypothetical protein